MTTVYGVTMYGAKLQIAKQLKDIDEYPQEHVNSGAAYLAQKTFESLNEMFTSSQEIQNWFTECATLISDDFHKNVEWNTPLGLYVQQPYFRNINQASVQVVSIYSEGGTRENWSPSPPINFWFYTYIFG